MGTTSRFWVPQGARASRVWKRALWSSEARRPQHAGELALRVLALSKDILVSGEEMEMHILQKR